MEQVEDENEQKCNACVNARGEEFGEIKREREMEDRMEERDS